MKKLLSISILLIVGGYVFGQEIKEVSIGKLLHKHNVYNNTIVSVTGYYISAFENHSIWNSKKESKKPNYYKSLWIGAFNKNIISLDKNDNVVDISFLYNKKVQITAEFKWLFEGHGHMNIWVGELINVTCIKEI